MGDGSPRATGGGKSGAMGGGNPRAAGGAEADCRGGETSAQEHGGRPHSRAWGLGQASPIQKSAPADQTVSILVLELLFYLILAFLALDQMI